MRFKPFLLGFETRSATCTTSTPTTVSNRSFWDLKCDGAEEAEDLAQDVSNRSFWDLKCLDPVLGGLGPQGFKPFLLGFEIEGEAGREPLEDRFKPFLLGFETSCLPPGQRMARHRFKPFLLGFETGRSVRRGSTGCARVSNRSFWDLKPEHDDQVDALVYAFQTVPSGI